MQLTILIKKDVNTDISIGKEKKLVESLPKGMLKYTIVDTFSWYTVHESKLSKAVWLEIVWLWERSPRPVMTLNCAVHYVISLLVGHAAVIFQAMKSASRVLWSIPCACT